MVLFMDVLLDTASDSIKMLPFLFTAFLVLEALERYSTAFINRTLIKINKAGPLVGSLFGSVPQCGFSVLASNLYAGGVISLGTLLSVFLATSDEAVLILIGNPGQGRIILSLLAAKVLIAVIAGYAVDILLAHRISSNRQIGNLCTHCGCDSHSGIFLPALNHTLKLFLYIFVVSGILNFFIQAFGFDSIAAVLLGDSVFQPLLAALIGFIPNCAASVILTQLYLGGALSFASVTAGLCANAGVGLLVLFRVNHDRKENIKIAGLLYLISVTAGLLISIF